ncbi:hypothetical protein ACFQZC_10855 [Streptacidiphilus monticola]
MALLAVGADVRWERVDALVRAAFARGVEEVEPGGEEGDLFALAQTTAVLTGGIVSIEDTANRILAYSRSSDSDEIDDLRRLTILGWQGPEPYLSKLREWGVFQQLRAGERVVAIDAHPELACGAGWSWRSGPGSGSWAPSGCRRAPPRWPNARIRRCWARPGWPRCIWCVGGGS